MTAIYRDGVRVISERMPPLGPLPPYEDPTTLTRRDRFAMAALTGLCANCDSTGMFSWTPEGVADYASQIADLMEAARDKEGGE